MAEDIERQPRQGYSGPPATLGSTLAANARVILMCRHCGHEAEPDLKHQILRYGAELPLPEWAPASSVRSAPRIILISS
jgi:hypothetical protein